VLLPFILKGTFTMKGRETKHNLAALEMHK